MFRAIIVDDEPLILDGMAQICESYDLDITIVAKGCNGLEAVELYKKYHPDLIIMDINMPILNGLEALAEIRKSNKYVISIILSSYTDFQYAKDAIDLGVNSYELKPINENDFYKKLKHLLHEYENRILELNIIDKKDKDVFNEDDIITYINENYHNPNLSSDYLEDKFNLSRTSIFKIMKRLTNMSLVEYITSIRIRQAKALLNTNKSFKEIGICVGYSDPYYFSRIFKKYTGLTLTEYQKGKGDLV